MDLISWFPVPGRIVRTSPSSKACLGAIQTFQTSYLGVRSNVIDADPSGLTSGNANLVLRPRGTGALIIGNPPDGLDDPGDNSRGGNNRGRWAVDLGYRSNNYQVPTGDWSLSSGFNVTNTGQACFGQGRYCTVAGSDSFLGGYQNSLTANQTIAYGTGLGGTGSFSALFGSYCTSSANYTFNAGKETVVSKTCGSALGEQATSDKYGQFSLAGGYFSSNADAQHSWVCGRILTTNATPAEMFLNGSSERLTIPANCTMSIVFEFVARTSTAAGAIESATFTRKVLVTRGSAANTTTIVGQNTVGTDITSAGLSTCAVTLSADTTNGAVKPEATGVAATNIRWDYNAHITQIIYA